MGKACIFASILLCMMDGSSATAQKVIHGYVKNEDTGEALPVASIQVEGTFRGTISNNDGEYIFELTQLPATILVRYIGFKSKRIAITEDSPSEQDILLKPIVLELEEIVVTAEDPALSIMREVIKRKQAWREKLETYKAEAYTRNVFENDTTIVFILESTSEIFWDHERGKREVVKSKRETSNLRSTGMFASASWLENFYEDEIELEGFKVIGPTHPEALRFYNFELEGQRYLDDKIVFDISVAPKSKLQSTFVGRISILDEEYAMIEVALKPSEAVLFPPPIQEWNSFHKQQFRNFGRAFWLPVDLRTEGDIKIKMIGLEFPTMKFNQISRLTNYQVNVSLPDSLYEKKKALSVDSLSVKQDTLLASKSYGIPLTDREKEAYATLDSTMTLEKAYKPTGFLARFAKVSSGEIDKQPQEKGPSRNLLSGFRPQAWHNRVDAFHLGLKTKNEITKRVNVRLSGAYKTGLDRWSYGGGLEYRWGKGEKCFLSCRLSDRHGCAICFRYLPALFQQFSNVTRHR